MKKLLLVIPFLTACSTPDTYVISCATENEGGFDSAVVRGISELSDSKKLTDHTVKVGGFFERTTVKTSDGIGYVVNSKWGELFSLHPIEAETCVRIEPTE